MALKLQNCDCVLEVHDARVSSFVFNFLFKNYIVILTWKLINREYMAVVTNPELDIPVQLVSTLTLSIFRCLVKTPT